MQRVERPTQHGRLNYLGGHVVLTATHLNVYVKECVQRSLALQHLTEADGEEAHTFRHRTLGMIVAATLVGLSALAIVSATQPGESPLQIVMRSWVGDLLFFSPIFSLCLVWGVLSSQRIHWLRVCYGGVWSRIAIPGAYHDEREEFMQALNDAIRAKK